ncbi:MAG: saccharopine dehydrogenase C-terminal domain-containing protein [Candidatus Aminicenantales bacterium]
MKKILVLGAGFVAGPVVKYFLERPETDVTVADMDLEKAKALVGSRANGQALVLNLRDQDGLNKVIAGADVVVSLVPYTFHPLVAETCIALRRNMVTTSYVGEAMRALDEKAREAGIVILNEVGLDPGIDHMEAMRIIHEVKNQGGKILGFTSYCGGLPAPEANNNPFGYKFSWSPRGVLLAGKNAAHYLKDGQDVQVSAESLFDHYTMIPVEGLGRFEGYPNRDALPYIGLYGIPETRTMFRGTLRYPGWCETLKKIADLGLLEQDEMDLRGKTHADLVRDLAGVPEAQDIKSELRRKLGLKPDSKVIDKLEWLGLLSEDRISLEYGSPLDVLEMLMLKRLQYEEGERDMVVLQHEFVAVDDRGKKQKITSTLIDFGVPGGDSSMARTVGLPAAVGTRLVLEGRIRRTGVSVPVHPEVYGPILEELENHGIIFNVKKSWAD